MWVVYLESSCVVEEEAALNEDEAIEFAREYFIEGLQRGTLLFDVQHEN